MTTFVPDDGMPAEKFVDDPAWERWLEEHHGPDRGVWLLFAKKGSGVASVTYREAVATALCFGWIDSRMRSVDTTWYAQRFTPRGPRSVWSQINTEAVAALTDAGRMRPAGLDAVERAKADGRWERAYAPPSRATVPDDLRSALDAAPGAAEGFDALGGQERYSVLFSLQNAKRPETRARRIAAVVERLARGDRPAP